MDRSEEFFRVCAVKSDFQAAELPILQYDASGFRTAARTIAKSISDVHALVLRTLENKYPTMSELIEVERDATLFSQTCGNDLAALEKFAEEVSVARPSTNRSLHQKGVVTILYQRLQGLMNDVKALRPVSRQLAFAQLADTQRPAADLQPLQPAQQHNKHGTTPSAQRTTGLQQQELQTRAAAQDTVTHVEETMMEVSSMIDLIANKLVEQQETIEELFEQAKESTQNVIKGNDQLKQAAERPNLLRDMTIIIFVVLALCLWVLEWLYS